MFCYGQDAYGESADPQRKLNREDDGRTTKSGADSSVPQTQGLP